MDLYNRLEKGLRKGQKGPKGQQERIRERPEDTENKIFTALFC